MGAKAPFSITRAFGALTGAVGLSACAGGALDPKGPVGAAEKLILIDALAIMLAIVIPVIVATLLFAWWFRASNTSARRLPDWDFSGRIELVVWSIPCLVVLFLGGLTWAGSHDLDPAKPLASKTKPLEVQVVSLDWKWLFIYPEQKVASVNVLVVPAGTPVHFSLTSASVMNAFFAPQLGSMIYTMGGMVDQLNLQADRPGRYLGESTHFSGDGFSGMRFWIDALTPQDFSAWVGRAQSSRGALDRDAYLALEQQSQGVAPTTYRDVPPGFFQAIATQMLPSGPGPKHGSPSPVVSPKTGD